MLPERILPGGIGMVAYVVVDAEILDPAKYEEYKKLSPGAIAKHGGRFLARGGQTAVLEGDCRPNRVVIIEFPSLEAARNFYTSVEYTAARRARAGAAAMNIVAVEGA
jgi:uncharacterized protein (DUF1330 family)